MQWGSAREQAAAERQSEWSTLCAAADKSCPHGAACSYAEAAEAFFAANAASLSRVELAVALRNILLSGPSKTTRAPMIIGPTNSGKSTLVLPFDELFGFVQVFHKPALGSSFALRNILKEKKFPLLGRLPSSRVWAENGSGHNFSQLVPKASLSKYKCLTISMMET